MDSFILQEISPFRNSIKNIIFDFGGVIFNIDYKKPIQEFQKMGILDFDSLYDKVAQTNVFDKLETGDLRQDEFIAFLKEKINSPSVTDKDILEAWNSILNDIPKSRVEIIHQLNKKYATYLLSNTNEIHVHAFEKIVDKTVGLAYFKSAFKEIYYSNEIGMRKPNKNIFELVCLWNDLKKEETLFIDDSIQHVRGAASCGIYSYHLDVTKNDIVDLFRDWC